MTYKCLYDYNVRCFFRHSVHKFVWEIWLFFIGAPRSHVVFLLSAGGKGRTQRWTSKNFFKLSTLKPSAWCLALTRIANWSSWTVTPMTQPHSHPTYRWRCLTTQSMTADCRKSGSEWVGLSRSMCGNQCLDWPCCLPRMSIKAVRCSSSCCSRCCSYSGSSGSGSNSGSCSDSSSSSSRSSRIRHNMLTTRPCHKLFLWLNVRTPLASICCGFVVQHAVLWRQVVQQVYKNWRLRTNPQHFNVSRRCTGRCPTYSWQVEVVEFWHNVWLGGVMVTTLDLWPKGHEFDSQLGHYQVVTILRWLIVCGQVDHFGIITNHPTSVG